MCDRSKHLQNIKLNISKETVCQVFLSRLFDSFLRVLAASWVFTYNSETPYIYYGHVGIVTCVARHQTLRLRSAPTFNLSLAPRILRYPLVSIRSDVVRETLYLPFLRPTVTPLPPPRLRWINVGLPSTGIARRALRRAENSRPLRTFECRGCDKRVKGCVLIWWSV